MPKLCKPQRKTRKRWTMGMQEVRTHIRRRSIHPIDKARTDIPQDSRPKLILFLKHPILYQQMNNHDAPVTATVSIELNPMLLEAVNTALIPESETPSSDRSETSITVEGNLLIIQTRASDTTALRASLNSYLRWVQGIQSIVESIK